MKNWKKVAIAIAVTSIIFTGCGDSIDKQKLADLTAQKSFKQIEEAYTMSVYNDNPNAKIYAYWLKENGKKEQPSFDFDLLEMKVQKGKKDIEKGVEKMIAKLPHMSYNSLKMLKTQTAFMGLSFKIYKEKLFPAISAEMHKRLHPKKAKK